jgi:hypothetical protein
MPNVPQRYTSLRVVGQIVRFVGALAVLVSIFLIGVGFTEIGALGGKPVPPLLGGGVGLLLGLGIAALGEIAICFVGIEHNTRRAAVATEGHTGDAATPDGTSRAAQQGGGQSAPPDHWRCQCGNDVVDIRQKCPRCSRSRDAVT